MKKNIFTSFLFLFVFTVFAQDYDSFFKDFVTQSWKAEDGIPGNSITDICQDEDGYILFGTYGGVTRFDGRKFLTINKIYDPKYNFISARAVMQDSKGNFWVGSNDEGAFCIQKDGTVISFTLKNGLPNNSIRSFCEDKAGNIWIGTASGIACISSDLKIIKLADFENLPFENRFIVSQLYCDTAGRVWIVTRRENGLFVYGDNCFTEYKGINSFEKPVVTAVSQDINGALWFGVSPYYGIKIDGGKETLFNLGKGEQKGTMVNCIYQDSAKNIWFGLDNGITILHDGDFSYYSKENGLEDESIVKIIEDKEKNIWIATDRGGIQKLSYGKFQTTSMQTTINAIAEDKFRKVVWLAGDNGLYCYKNNHFIENEITSYCKNIRIRHVAVTEQGELLVSTYEKLGQLKFNLDGNVNCWTTKNGLAGDRVRVAEKISNGDIYIGTTTGLSIIDGKTGEITNIVKSDKLQNDYIMCLYEAEDGSVWVGTDGGGIFILKNREIFKIITKENKLAGNVIFKITDFNSDEIWITTGTGLSRYKDDEIFTFNSSNGFGTDGVFQVIPDFSGRLWGTTNRGIFFVKMKEMDSVIAGTKSAVNIKYYNRLDGIASGGVTSTSLGMKDEFGRIWFTLIDGFTIFDPVRNATKNTAPDVKIEDILIDFEKAVPVNDQIVIPPEAKRLEINFTGISFISSEQIIFKTKLEGFEKDYTDWTSSRTASYTNLKPGTYHFSVIAQNGDEVLCQEPAVIKIVKVPYLWQRPWFIVILIVIILGLITLYVYKKLESLKQEQKLTEKLSIEVIQALVGTIDAKDKYTNGHSKRVAEYSKMLAEALGLDEKHQKEVYYSALLHDIGKIGIPDPIINKPEKLTSEEYDIIKTHPSIGSQILSSIASMKDISIGARSHHEHFDGTGYPDKKRGNEIPLTARIIAVADAYDAMTSNRSYRKYMSQEYVKSEFSKHSGSQFDPLISQKMIEIMEKDEEYKLHE